MAYVSIRGVDHYFEWVTEEFGVHPSRPLDSQKPVLVFIHGWAGSTRYWRRTALALADRFDCLLYDMRGFGRSHLPRPLPDDVKALGYSLESYAEDLARLLDVLCLDRVIINAHSTGASIATMFLNRWTDRVQAAILTCSGIFNYNKLTFSIFHRVSNYVVALRPRWFLRVPFLDRFFMVRFLKRQIPASDYREFLEDFIDADEDAAIGTIYTAVSETASLQMPKEFQQLQVPTLLISGEYDQIIPVKLGINAARLSPWVEHVIIRNTGHFPMLEDADTYLSTIMPFLEKTLASNASYASP